MARRENTFRIDLANIPKKPSYEEVHNFVATNLGLKREQVHRIQCSRSASCVFVKVIDHELAHKVCDDHDGKHEIEVDGEKYVVRIRMEDGAVEVKLFDLPEDISEQCIVDFLKDFGEVLSIREQMWTDQYTFGGTSTGVWIARMVVKRNIPSYVTIDGETTFLAYYGQLQSCKHCGEHVHNGASCVQNKKLMIQKLAADSTAKQSYANVTKNSIQPNAIGLPKPSKPSTVNQHQQRPQQSNTKSVNTHGGPSTSTMRPGVSGTPTSSALFKKPNTNQQLPTTIGHHSNEKQSHKRNRNDGGESDDSSTTNNAIHHHEKEPRYDVEETAAVDLLEN